MWFHVGKQSSEEIENVLGWEVGLILEEVVTFGPGLESEYEKPGLAETWRKLTGTGVGRCRSST